MLPTPSGAFPRIDAVDLTVLRFGVASLALAALLVGVEGSRALRIEARGHRLWLLGALGLSGFSVSALVALDHPPVPAASLIVATAPVIAALAFRGWRRDCPSAPCEAAA